MLARPFQPVALAVRVPLTAPAATALARPRSPPLFDGSEWSNVEHEHEGFTAGFLLGRFEPEAPRLTQPLPTTEVESLSGCDAVFDTVGGEVVQNSFRVLKPGRRALVVHVHAALLRTVGRELGQALDFGRGQRLRALDRGASVLASRKPMSSCLASRGTLLVVLN